MDTLVIIYDKINAKGNVGQKIKNDDEIKLRNHLSKNKGFFAKKCWKKVFSRIE
jgi:hypothetical protein